MQAGRFRTLSWWLAGVYFAWSLLVYFGTYYDTDHGWWPMFLYPLIFPVSFLFESVISPFIQEWLIPDSKVAPPGAFTLFDQIAGCFYIVAGTVWLWFVGRFIAWFIAYFLRHERSKPKSA
jgi:hypothetical protein